MIKNDFKGTFEHIPILDEVLKKNNIRGLLIGGVARAYHISKRNPKKAKNMLPRKDTDIMIIDKGYEDLIIDGVDVQKRFNYGYKMDPNSKEETNDEFPYWSNQRMILDVTFPNIDNLSHLNPGLYIPDELFLIRMLSRYHFVRRQIFRELPVEIENMDPPFDIDIWKVKFHRHFYGDPENVISLDNIIVRGITNREKYCLITDYSRQKRNELQRT